MRVPDSLVELAPSLARIDPEAGLWMFGSWARGRVRSSSDVDALVVVSARTGLDEARDLCLTGRINAIVTDRGSLGSMPSKSPLFALHLCTEARPVLGRLQLPPISWGAVHRDAAMRRATSRLRAALRELATWGADDCSVQTTVFAAVKEWAMLRAAISGEPEFDRWRALRRCGIGSKQELALAGLEAVWEARRAHTPAPALSDPDCAIREALKLAPVAASA